MKDYLFTANAHNYILYEDVTMNITHNLVDVLRQKPDVHSRMLELPEHFFSTNYL